MRRRGGVITLLFPRGGEEVPPEAGRRGGVILFPLCYIVLALRRSLYHPLLKHHQLFMAYFFSPFRKTYTKNKKASARCPFCDDSNVSRQQVCNTRGEAVENEHYQWLVNYFPKFEGHTIIVSREHVTEINGESPDVVVARERLIAFAIRTLQQLYRGAGVEVFLQFGPGSAATLEHLHWHVVPARPDDPLRSFEKLGHFYRTGPRERVVLEFPHRITLAKKKLQKALSKIIGARTEFR